MALQPGVSLADDLRLLLGEYSENLKILVSGWMARVRQTGLILRALRVARFPTWNVVAIFFTGKRSEK
jgi:hypothetical protein